MKQKILILFLVFSFVSVFASCDKGNEVLNSGTTQKIENTSNTGNINETMSSKIKIKIGSSIFCTSLENNATATAFKAILPMTINMTDLNNNEKYFDFSTSLPTNASNPGSMQTGDLMLYGSRTLVLFYKTFSTSYPYTKLGHIDDTIGLSAALGNGNVSVTFELL
jgi:hypothetical protein